MLSRSTETRGACLAFLSLAGFLLQGYGRRDEEVFSCCIALA